jgi:hypothetical protein
MITIKMKPLAQACALIFSMGSLVMENVIAAPHAPAGSSIVNQITMTFKDAYGKSYELKSNIVNIMIREIYTAKLMPISGTVQKVPADGGSKVYSIIKLYNTGNKIDTYQLSAINNVLHDSINADEILIYRDTNGNGQLDANEMTVLSNITLDGDASATLIVVTKLPATVAKSDTLYIELNAISVNGAKIDKLVSQIKITFSDKTTITTPIIIWKPGDGGNCHAYTSIPLAENADSWSDAKLLAAESVYAGLHGHLATLNTFDEIEFIRSAIDRSQNHWIGGFWNGTNWGWGTGESSYVSAEGMEPGDFPQFVWAAGGWKGGDQHAYIWNRTNDGKWATSSNLWTDNVNPIRALVEFDIACPAPSVELVLTAAKDIGCDGSPDSAFDAIDLADMAPGECAIMHVRARNTSGISAIDVFLKQVMPNYLTYVPNTIASCGWDDSCSLVARTDNETDKDNGYFDSVNNTVVIGGKPTNLGPGDIIHGQYRLRID